MFKLINDLISFLNLLLRARNFTVEVTRRLGATDLGGEVRAPLARETDTLTREADTTPTWPSFYDTEQIV